MTGKPAKPTPKPTPKPKRKPVKKVGPPQKRVIARGKALGKPHKTIAKEADVSVRTVEDFARVGAPAKVEAECAMIHQFGQRHADKLDELYAEAIESCRQDLTDDLGSVRATARAQAVAIIQASDKYQPPPEEQDAGQGQYTLTELLVSYHRATVEAGGGAG